MAKKKTSDGLVLSDIHMTKLELGTEKQKNATHEVRGLDSRLQLLRSDIELLKAHIKLKESVVREIQRMVPDFKKRCNDLKNDEIEYLKDVKKELGIKAEKWGYDPDSGEVIITEEDKPKA